CPLTPIAFLREALATAVAEDVVVVGVQPVTDTIKTVEEGVVGGTVDREGLWAVTSPVVLPADVVAELDAWPDADDFTALVSWLRQRFEVRFLEAPALGRRVEDESSLALLEALAAG
ncbi:MAG TPA: 2-C-methyl-D-erythritol 4-phosphate cytidylyltransferase, partial [Nocardioidaceae bacterium]|nr:2-C-methyl-D-erythritol 4-phosphate cytidylyltransferase [Nocardioidaceae bacterium]